MKSVKDIYKIGKGPSSSHSMGPAKAASLFLNGLAGNISHIEVVLYDSLASTGNGHCTDKAIGESLFLYPVKFKWKPDVKLPYHPNALDFIAYNNNKEIVKQWRVYSVGGGQLHDSNGTLDMENKNIYPHNKFMDIIEYCRSENLIIWEYVGKFENDSIWEFLKDIWDTMKESVENGLETEEQFLPGPLKLQRRAGKMLKYANKRVGTLRDRNLLSSYALAVAEENASGGTIVTAPTCGSCGVLPAVLYFFWLHYDTDVSSLTKALAIAAMVASAVIENASISGAEVGCQGEIGVACAMAAAAATFLLNGSNNQIEYSAEMGLEHFLGLTCDPVYGLVQVPCIERNAFAAMRSMDCAAYSLATEGDHLVNLDNVIDVMNETGRDLQSKYRETAMGGLAGIMHKKLTSN